MTGDPQTHICGFLCLHSVHTSTVSLCVNLLTIYPSIRWQQIAMASKCQQSSFHLLSSLKQIMTNRQHVYHVSFYNPTQSTRFSGFTREAEHSLAVILLKNFVLLQIQDCTAVSLGPNLSSPYWPFKPVCCSDYNFALLSSTPLTPKAPCSFPRVSHKRQLSSNSPPGPHHWLRDGLAHNHVTAGKE